MQRRRCASSSAPPRAAATTSESEEDLVDELSETLQSGGEGFDEETADCFAEIVVDEVGVEELQDVDLTADEPPEELQDEIAAAAVRAAEECDLSEPAADRHHTRSQR